MKYINNLFENHLIENREVRIFLSSTFSDMNDERSALVKLFNKLKIEASKRNVALSLLDLRWGVTDEESRTGKVLSVCLNEIENSHPFFIGLLGSRYGYSPKVTEFEKNPELKERYPWLCKDIAQNLSITEIEMQYGVLRNQANVDAAFFIKNTPNMPPDDNEKLSVLKTKIRKQKRFPVGEYKSVEHLCEQVEKMVMELLDKYFIEGGNTQLERERNLQLAYINNRHRCYVRCQEDFNRLHQFFINEEKNLVVTGASGIGKSALIANWLKEQEKKFNLPYHIIYHFVGNIFGGNEYKEILQHISDELIDLLDGAHEDIYINEGAEQKAQKYMSEVVHNGKSILIVIDGINQIANHDNAKLLNWLPQSSQNVKYLFSTLENDETMDTFLRLGYPIYVVKPLSNNQRRSFIINYLEQVGKHVNAAQLNRILLDPKNENTLILKTLLDELICFGSHEKLDDCIDYYHSATSIPDFFNRMLKRMEADYIGVQHLLALLAVSEHGLSEDELVTITDMRQIDFHLFYCSFAQHLVTCNGLIVFAHQYIKDTVWNRYHLYDVECAKPIRLDIIRYFSTCEHIDSKRRISELAFQYYHNNDYEQLYRTILNFEAFRFFDSSNIGRAQLALYWRILYTHNSERYKLINYFDLSTKGIGFENHPYLRLGMFIIEYISDYQAALKYTQFYLSIAQSIGVENTEEIARSFNNIGVAYNILGEYERALEYHFKALSIREKTLGKEHPYTAYSYANIGDTYINLLDHNEGQKYLFKALSVREKVLGKNHLDTACSYDDIGSFYIAAEEYDTALEYHIKALTIREKTLGTEHIYTASSYNNIGADYEMLLEYEKALDYYFKALAIREKLLGMEHPHVSTSFNNIGGLYNKLGYYDKALEYYFKALSIREKCLGFMHPRTVATKLSIGSVYGSLGYHDRQQQIISQVLNNMRNCGGHVHVDNSVSK